MITFKVDPDGLQDLAQDIYNRVKAVDPNARYSTVFHTIEVIRRDPAMWQELVKLAITYEE